MVFCRKCGARYEKAKRFCPKCGTQFIRYSKKKTAIAIPIIILVFLSVLVLFNERPDYNFLSKDAWGQVGSLKGSSNEDFIDQSVIAKE